MRNPKRITVIMKKITQLWQRYPDLRFFQLVEMLKSKCPMSDVFYFEDDDLETIIEMEFEPNKKTPDEWCRIHKIQIIDADGWDRTNRNWSSIPITEKEFFANVNDSTCSGDLNAIKKYFKLLKKKSSRK